MSQPTSSLEISRKPARIAAEDTIAAIATPLGEGALGILRLSGPGAIPIAQKVFVPSGKLSLAAQKSHTVRHGWLMRDGRKIDEVMAAVYRSPASYTGEDTVEITGHGGYAVLRASLQALMDNGARLAEPGEFTKRAFLNGKMDLAQAEAVMELIQAKSDLALQAGLQGMAGGLSRRLRALRDEILVFYAPLEAAIDFPEEDIEGSSMEELGRKITDSMQKAAELLIAVQGSRIRRDGIQTAILGRPNAGKSSLFNALLLENRALVSDIAGTTRDALEETAAHRGYSLCFVDTAGIRAKAGKVETQGIERTLEKAQNADIVLYLVDRSKTLHAQDAEFVSKKLGRKNGVIVFTKTDLPSKISAAEEKKLADGIKTCHVSAHNGTGLVALKDEIISMATQSIANIGASDVTANERQIAALAKTREALEQALHSCREGQSYEVIALDAGRALQSLGEITGENASEELLHAIFSRFCIGK